MEIINYAGVIEIKTVSSSGVIGEATVATDIVYDVSNALTAEQTTIYVLEAFNGT